MVCRKDRFSFVSFYFRSILSPLSAVIERHSILHHSYADDSQLQSSATPDRLPDLIDSMRLCIDDIKDWMTDNKLKRNEGKTGISHDYFLQ